MRGHSSSSIMEKAKMYWSFLFQWLFSLSTLGSVIKSCGVFLSSLLQAGFQTDFSFDHLSADYDIAASKIIQECGLFYKKYASKAT